MLCTECSLVQVDNMYKNIVQFINCSKVKKVDIKYTKKIGKNCSLYIPMSSFCTNAQMHKCTNFICAKK